MFDIERSKDGKNWEFVTSTPGAGDSSIEIEYQALDYQPYTGISYYRLKQTDFDGEYSYSDPVSVYIENEDLIIYPNPSQTGVFTINQEGLREENVILTDASGRRVQILLVQNGQESRLDASTLPPGVYLLNILSSNKTVTHRIIID